MNPVAIEGHLILVLIQWMIIIAAAYVFGRLGRFLLKQPLAVGEIAAGIILGPSLLGAVWPPDWLVLFPKETQTSTQLLGKLGLIFCYSGSGWNLTTAICVRNQKPSRSSRFWESSHRCCYVGC